MRSAILISLTPITGCEGPYPAPECPIEGIGPAYYPFAAPLNLVIAQGWGAGSEVNYTVMLNPLLPTPGVRVGGKNLLADAPVKLASDYGASLSFADAGLLVGVPLMESEVYGAVRAFGNLYWDQGANLSAALTLGVSTVLEGTEGFLELTLTTGSYNHNGPKEGVQPIGFSLVPALGLMF